MFDHVSIGVRDLACAKRFYDAALHPLGYVCLSDNADALGYGRDKIALWIGKATRPVPPDRESNLHFCFAAPTREAVDAFHVAAVNTGGADNGAPGVCAQTVARTTTPPSRSTPTNIASRHISALRRLSGMQVPPARANILHAMSRTRIAVWLENHKARRELRRYASLDPRFARDVGLTSDALAVVCAAPRGLLLRARDLSWNGSMRPVSKICLIRSNNQRAFSLTRLRKLGG